MKYVQVETVSDNNKAVAKSMDVNEKNELKLKKQQTKRLERRIQARREKNGRRE